MNFLSYGNWFNYDEEVEKIAKYFDIKDVKYIGCNNEGIVIDFSYNDHMYGYQRLTNAFNEDRLSDMQMLVIDLWNAKFSSVPESINIEICDLETLIDINTKSCPGISKERLRDWTYLRLIFHLIRIHVDDADGCKHLESLSYHDFKNNPEVEVIIDKDILQECEMYIKTIDDDHIVLDFQKDSARDAIYMAYYLITMNHPLMEMVKQYPEYKPRFCKVVEVARQLGLHEEQLIISDFTASIKDQPDKWEL